MAASRSVIAQVACVVQRPHPMRSRLLAASVYVTLVACSAPAPGDLAGGGRSRDRNAASSGDRRSGAGSDVTANVDEGEEDRNSVSGGSTGSPAAGSSGATSGGATSGGSTSGGPLPADGGTSDGGFTRGPSIVLTPQAGPNTVDLAAAGPGGGGTRMTFVATLTPAAGADLGTLSLSAMAIDNTGAQGVRLYRPAFLVEAGAATLAAVTLNDVDMSVPSRRKTPFARNQVVIDAWRAGASLRIAFGALVASTTTVVTGLPADIYAECKAASQFTAVSGHWNQTTCRNCHSGLFSLDYIGVDNATACGLNRKLLRAGGPNLTRPTTSGHPGGLMPNAGVYTQALNAWRAAEQ